MSNVLRDAIDHIQGKLDNDELIDYTDAEELQMIIEAAYRYWDQCDEEENFE